MLIGFFLQIHFFFICYRLPNKQNTVRGRHTKIVLMLNQFYDILVAYNNNKGQVCYHIFLIFHFLDLYHRFLPVQLFFLCLVALRKRTHSECN